MIFAQQDAVATSAEDNVFRNAKIQECRRQIDKWSNRLQSLEDERSKAILCSKLRHDAVTYASSLTIEQRRDTDILLAAIESREPLPFLNYVATDYDRLDTPVRKPPFIPSNLLCRENIVRALIKLPDFRNGMEAYINELNCKVLGALTTVDDRELLVALYAACPRLFEYASDEMKHDRECVLKLIRNNKLGYRSDGSRYIPKSLWNEKEILLTALSLGRPFVNLKDIVPCIPASSSLRDDIEIARTGLKPNLDQPATHTIRCSARAVFPELSERLRGERNVVGMLFESGHDRCCARSSGILKHCSNEIKSDKEIVLKFCHRSGRELEYASPSLQCDEEVVRAACMNDGGSLKYCPPKLREALLRDDAFVSSWIQNFRGFEIFGLLPTEMQNDETIVSNMSRYRNVYDALPKKWKNDKQFWLKALDNDPVAYGDLPESLQSDYDLLRTALMKKAPDVFAGLSWCDKEDFEKLFERFPRFLADKELILSILNQAAWHDTLSFNEDFFVKDLLPKFSSLHARDVEFWIAVCQQDARSFLVSPEEMKLDSRVVTAALSAEKSMVIIHQVPAWAQKDHPNLIVDFMENLTFENATTKQVFDQFAPEVWSNHTVARAFAGNYSCALLYLPANYKSDAEIVLAAISFSYHAFNSASFSLKSDPYFVRMAIATDYQCFGLASKQLRDDFSMQVFAVASDSRSISFCTTRGWESRAFTDHSPDTFDKRVALAAKIRNRIAQKEIFVTDFLRGIDNFGGSMEQCPLSVLNLGVETLISIKRHIAEYAGIPLGEELRQLREASRNLVIQGF